VDRVLQIPGPSVTEWIDWGQTLGPVLLRALVLALITWIAARTVRRLFERSTVRFNADPGLVLLIGRFLYLSVLAIGGITILDALGLPLATLVTVLGVIGIGISLALQDILKNFFAGTYLLFERPFRIGDVVQVKDQRGTVETIGIRTITLRTSQNVQVMVPNAMVFTEIVLNRTLEEDAPKRSVAE
jgi:small conductance mechanosensitive channel